jgi:hypothetical protein
MPTMSLSISTPVTLREVTLPKEHGSWSLAFEPVVLGLLATPSLAGLPFALAIAAAFLARRPLRLVVYDRHPARRAAAWRALVGCGGIAGLGLTSAIALGGIAWLGALAPAIICGSLFVAFDLRKDNRAALAELAGTLAFASLPLAFARLGGATTTGAAALAFAMAVRSVPTVLCVRTAVRARKTGELNPVASVLAAIAALGLALFLARTSLAPWTLAALAAGLMARTFLLLVFPRPPLRARTLGIIEAVIGAVFVLACGLTWPRP